MVLALRDVKRGPKGVDGRTYDRKRNKEGTGAPWEK